MSTETETAPSEERELTAADFEPEDGEEGTEVQTEAPPSSETASQEETVSQEDGEGEQPPEEGEPPEGEADPYAEAPEFWPASRKALWDSKQIPPDVRQAIHEHVQDVSRSINDKLMEAAETKKTAETRTAELAKEREAAASYWANPINVMQAMFQGRWGNVDLAKVAADNPAEAVKLREMRDQEWGVIQQVAQQHQRETQALEKQTATNLETAKRTEHEKLASKLPQYFGSEKAQATYDELGDFLASKGVPRDRIANIYEAPVIEIALEAMLYSKAQAKLKSVGTKPTTQAQPATATQTSRRITPGARTGQPTKGNAMRQAEQRLRDGQDLSDDEAALLFG